MRVAIVIGLSLLTGVCRAGDGPPVSVSGELACWRTVTFTVTGPTAKEADTSLNPFTDYRFTLTVKHTSGSPVYRIPGYFAADGDAGNTSAAEGAKWRAHFCPDKAGEWGYAVSLVKGADVALAPEANGEATTGNGASGTFTVAAADPAAPGFRSRGRLEYVGKRYLRFAGTGEYFLKFGADSPETLLAYADFDGTEAGRQANGNQALKTWTPHLKDWKAGDPTWKGGKGKGLIGAVNYLADQGVNGLSFLTYNVGGDGDNVWPFAGRTDKLHYDCSKLDQWRVVFEHAQDRGLFLHFKLQEQECDDDRVVAKGTGETGDPKDADGKVPAALDGGQLGRERKLYCRELVARFGHLLALNWNLGEENTQSTAEQVAMAGYFHKIDPYKHHVVVHTFPNRQDAIYTPLLGKDSPFTGASLQNAWNAAHPRTLKWVTESGKAGKPWVVCNDEQGPAGLGVPPDKGYAGFDGVAAPKGKGKGYTADDVRKHTLWGTLTAGGAGVEYYFGYQLPQNDLNCEDFRSRHGTWASGRHALHFFRDHTLPIADMANADELVGNPGHGSGNTCLAQPGAVYVVALPNGGTAELDLSKQAGEFTVAWFDPRNGGKPRAGSVAGVPGGGRVSLGTPPDAPTEDWVVLVRKRR